VAPVLGIIKETILFGSILLFAFEAAILYKIWLSTKDFEREYRKIRTAAESLDEAGKESDEGAKQTG
jgi:hypothetical protein